MKKRHLFAELSEGFDALAKERQGKITLKKHAIDTKPTLDISAEELVTLRQKFNLSRAVFARYLRTNERTLEGWEQNRAHPNAQAVTLIKLVERYPDTLKKLSSL